MQNEGEVLLVSFLDFTVSCFHLAATKTSGEAKNYDFSKYFFTMCTNPEPEMTTYRTMKNSKLSHMYKCTPLKVTWLPFLLTTSNFEPKRNRLRPDDLSTKLRDFWVLPPDKGKAPEWVKGQFLILWADAFPSGNSSKLNKNPVYRLVSLKNDFNSTTNSPFCRLTRFPAEIHQS